MIKKDNLLKQELTDKEIMFIRLQNLEKENDMLHERVIKLYFKFLVEDRG